MEASDASLMASSAIASKRMWASSAHADVNSRASSALADVNSSPSMCSWDSFSQADVNFFSLMSAMQMGHHVPPFSDVNFSIRCLLFLKAAAPELADVNSLQCLLAF